MRAVYPKYQPKWSKCKPDDDRRRPVICSPMVRLPETNVFSSGVLSGDTTTAVAYSRGKLSAFPELNIWDD